MPELPVVFFSDAHLGAESKAREAAREARLHEFLNSLPGRASRLVIVGDLFDFWFEYRTAIPRRLFPTLAVLQRLRECSLPIDYLNGNHDFWLGPFLAQELGVTTYDGAMTLERDGRRIWIHHGDGIARGDHGYRLLKRVLRNPLSIALYRLIHPDLGIPLAHRVSNGSRHAQGERPLPEAQLWEEIAMPRFREGYDAVILGHFHHPYERRESGRELFVLGDWIRHFTWLELDSGTLTLHRPQSTG
ncbi:MAG: UDP-2,3-diacylglucosamine diphosphatase [Candidatus Eisenbacteria bacterium]|nr:UDP-2,3-diacylglucosamine diphosphatase [Candidatus Eisenbacteria bacterium]